MKENINFAKGVLLMFRTCYFHNDVLFRLHDDKLFEIIACRSAEILSVVRQRKNVEPSSHYRALKQIELISPVEITLKQRLEFVAYLRLGFRKSQPFICNYKIRYDDING